MLASILSGGATALGMQDEEIERGNRLSTWRERFENKEDSETDLQWEKYSKGEAVQ